MNNVTLRRKKLSFKGKLINFFIPKLTFEFEKLFHTRLVKEKEINYLKLTFQFTVNLFGKVLLSI